MKKGTDANNILINSLTHSAGQVVIIFRRGVSKYFRPDNKNTIHYIGPGGLF